MEHAQFAPSSIYRVIACPASFQLVQTIPAAKPSEFAIHGTLLHKVVEEMKDGDRKKYENLSNEDQGYVQDCFDYIELVKKGIDGKYVEGWETRVSLDTWGIPEIWGTSDYCLQCANVMHIMDWKFGQGVQVFANMNEQLLCYAAGVVGYPVLDAEISIHIVQPPLNHYDTFSFKRKLLEEFIFDALAPAVKEAKGKYPSFHAGEKQCRFCPAGVRCPSRIEKAERDAKTVFKDARIVDVVSDERLSYLLDISKDLKNAIKAIQLEALNRGLAGKNFPNWKVVAGRSIRKWGDEKQATKWLSERGTVDYFITKLISPAQAEKQDRNLKKDKFFQQLITKGMGKPTLAPISDKREPIVKDAFKDV